MFKKAIPGIASSLFALALFFFQWWAQEAHIIVPDKILLYAFLLFSVVSVVLWLYFLYDLAFNRDKFGLKPKIEDFMIPIIVNHTPGMEASKDIQLRIPSAQYWYQRLSPSQRDKILSLVKWLGQDPRDYEDTIRKLSPPSGSPDISFKWRR